MFVEIKLRSIIILIFGISKVLLENKNDHVVVENEHD